MRHVDAHEWELLKKHAAAHLTDPNWYGGAYCVAHTEVHARVHLPVGPWDAVVLARTVRPGSPSRD